MMTHAKSLKYSAAIAIGTVLLSSCAGHKKAARAEVARATVSGYSPNTEKGAISFTPAGEKGLRIHGEVKGLLPNRSYAMHIHENGSCTTPEASGSHFDPGNSNQHGSPGGSPGAHHAGDLPNLNTDKNGVGQLDFTTNAFGVGTSDFSVIGRSIVIHSDKDDFQSQPAGNSGEKIACGVIQPAGAPAG